MRLGHLPLLAGLPLVPATVAFTMPVAQQEYLEIMHARADPERGAQYFVTCAGCHGPKGDGTVNGEFPRIAGQYFPVLARQLVAFRHGLRWDFRMENFADRHRLQDAQAIADVAAYTSRLEDTAPAGIGTGEFLGHGANVYFRLCESCHGTSGQGDPEHAIPRIGGQHYEYLRRQIHDAVEGRRPGFPAFHVKLFARLEYADIDGVADYLARIAPHYAEQPTVIPVAQH